MIPTSSFSSTSGSLSAYTMTSSSSSQASLLPSPLPTLTNSSRLPCSKSMVSSPSTTTRHSEDIGNGEQLHRSISLPEPYQPHEHDKNTHPTGIPGEKVFYVGKVSYQAGETSILLPKSRRGYFVLTSHYLLRYKSLQKTRIKEEILDLFDGNSAINTNHRVLSLKDIFAIHYISSTANTFRIEHMHQVTKQPQCLTITADTLHDCQRWVDELRHAVQQVHQRMNFCNATLSDSERYAVLNRMAKQNDSLDNPMVQKVLIKEKRPKASKDGTTKYSEVYLVVLFAIGRFSFYLLPIAGPPNDAHLKVVGRDRYGLLAIQNFSFESGKDDTVELVVRQVNHPSDTRKSSSRFLLISSLCETVVMSLRQAIESLMPFATTLSYTMHLPKHLENTRLPRLHITLDDHQEVEQPCNKDNQQFNVTLHSYCAALNLNKARFAYSITGDRGCQTFTLLPPNEIRDSPPYYSRYELLAICRSLVYNPIFQRICLADHSLQVLEEWSIDKDDGWTCYPNGPTDSNVLCSELQAIIWDNLLLQEIDLRGCKIGYGNCPSSSVTAVTILGEALRLGRSGINCICLASNRIKPGEFQVLLDGIKARARYIRDIDLHHCGLATKQIELLLKIVTRKAHQLRVLDVACDELYEAHLPQDLVDDLFSQAFHPHLRVLRLRGYRIPLHANTLYASHLGELCLSNNPFGQTEVALLCQWIKTPSFKSIQCLHLSNCGLNGTHVSQLFICISQSGHRQLHLNLSGNPLLKDVAHSPKLFYAILQSQGPCSLSFANTEWEDATIRELLDCLRDNSTLAHLDLTNIRVSCPSLSTDTGHMLGSLFERNSTLESLKLSIKAHGNLGSTVAGALKSLCHNTTLRRLELDGLHFGDSGAVALADALRHNQTLQALSIDDNRITIEGYRVLARAIESNIHIIDFPKPRKDLRYQLSTLRTTIHGLVQTENETRWFIMHSAGMKTRDVKTQLHLQMQARQNAEKNYVQIIAVIDGLLRAVGKNKRAFEAQEQMIHAIEKLSATAAQDLTAAQLKLQGRSSSNNGQKSEQTSPRCTISHGSQTTEPNYGYIPSHASMYAEGNSFIHPAFMAVQEEEAVSATALDYPDPFYKCLAAGNLDVSPLKMSKSATVQCNHAVPFADDFGVREAMSDTDRLSYYLYDDDGNIPWE